MSNHEKIEAEWRPGVIDLAPGFPSDDLLPLGLMRSAAAAALAGTDVSFLQYGPEQGDGSLRQLLAQLLQQQTGAATSAREQFVTAGASQALDVLCTLFTRPGQAVLVAEPTYFLALEVFADHGLDVEPVPCDEDGPLPDALEAAIEAHDPAFFYLVPSFANPSGTCLTPQRQQELLTITQRAGTLVISDEVYRLLQFTGAPPPSLAAADLSHVVALNSFSKILAPGLRLGWMTAHPDILRRIEESGFLRSGGGLNPFTGALVAQLLDSGQMSHHLQRLRRTYAERAAALSAALKRHAPRLVFDEPRGGYFLWAQLPGVDPAQLRQQADEASVGFAPGAAFSTGGRFQQYLRLSFSHYPPNQLQEGAARLGKAIDALS